MNVKADEGRLIAYMEQIGEDEDAIQFEFLDKDSGELISEMVEL